MEEYIEEGAKAARDNKGHVTNPYHPADPAHAYWAIGWRRANNERLTKLESTYDQPDQKY